MIFLALKLSILFKALPENKHRVGGFGESLEPEEAAEWRKRAREYAQDLEKTDQPEQKPKRIKWHRIASYHWLCCLDLGLQANCGFGLAKFLLKEPRNEAPASATTASPDAAANVMVRGRGRGRVVGGRGRGSRGPGRVGPPLGGLAAQAAMMLVDITQSDIARAVERAKLNELPVFSISTDQGSVGWPALFYLLFSLGMMLVPMTEPPHRVWNDVSLSINQVDVMREARQLSTLLFGLNCGPFDSAAWFHKEQLQTVLMPLGIAALLVYGTS